MARIWINAGELSGDIHGGALLAALKAQCPELESVGMGGECLARSGQRNLFDVKEISVMGITEVLAFVPRVLRIWWGIWRALKELRPDAVILIDAPEFNFRVASMAQMLGIPVYYYILPKVWAWRTGRVRFLQSHARRLFSILPFEVDFYRQRGVEVDFIGNPLVDMLPDQGQGAPVAGRIGIMAGSRNKEIDSLMPEFAKAAAIVAHRNPDLSFHCLRAPNMRAERLQELWQGSGVPLHMEEPENRYDFMRSCQCILAASGTATLETALAGTPTIVAYKLSPLSYQFGRHLIKVQYASLTNLILNRELFPEMLQDKANGALLAAKLQEWLDSPAELESIRTELHTVRRLCGEKGGAKRAAVTLLRDMKATDCSAMDVS